MKYLLLLLLVAFVRCDSGGQAIKKKGSTPQSVIKNKKEFEWPKPIRDSLWFDSICDTIFGIIEVNIAGGKMKGNGMIVECTNYENHQAVYSAKDQAAIDSFYNAQKRNSGNWFAVSGGSYGIGTPTKAVYIKYKDGYKIVDDKFTFIPN